MNAVTVFKKELIDVMRDRRTLIFMLIIPTLSIPLLMWITTELMVHFSEKLAKEQSDVLVINPQVAPELVTGLKERSNIIGRTQRIAKLLQEKGITEQELSMLKGEPQGFLNLLKERGVDPNELAAQLRVVSQDEEFEFSPSSIMAAAFPPNFNIVTELPGHFGNFRDPADKEQVLLQAVRLEEIAAAIEFDKDTQARLAAEDDTLVRVFYLQTSDRSATALGGLKTIFSSLGKDIAAQRIRHNNLPAGFAKPIKVRSERLPGPSLIVKILSQILPYLILIFAMLGALYPAIDLGAGEKERGTLETLLVAPVGRLSIVLGKFGVILVAALVSAVLATVSLAISLQVGVFSTFSMFSEGSFSFSLTEALAAILMVVPVACIFASLLLAISIFAKSFKEAQSYASPLQMVIVMPAFVSFIPGVKLDWLTSSLPVVNISLALKEIFTGNLDQHWAHVGVIFLSTSVYAGLLLWFATWWFQREQVLFRS
jgi:ABC-type Na+ efflux pump permease subunit